ncbi:restriction endonuclease subunit S [Malaciobacter canalis]|uniref:restriction endonuclease subunit S n=1 Tax=Malaciobacter canalis TaxID=1912871 RepID=UPI00384DC84B
MSNKENIPKLRFKEFSGEWEEKYFGDIYSFLQTNSFSRALLNYEDGDVKNIHYGDIHTKFKSNFYIQDETVPYINQDVDLTKIKEENYCKEKDLVIADASEDYKDIGKAIELIDLNNEKLLAGLHTYIARDDKDKMALGFSGYFMQTHNVRVQMMKMATGISVLGISKGNLNKLELTIPQKQEQEKIASFLSSIDKKINQLSKKDELLQNYKKAMMQKIFSQKLRFKKEDGSDYTKWEEKKLKEIATFFSGGTPSSTNKNYYNGDIPFIGSGKINSDNVEQFITSDALENSSAKMVNVGDLLYALYGATSGQVAISKIRGAINQAVLCIRSEENLAFLYFWLSFKQDNIISTYLQGGQGNLSAQIIKDLKINLPYIEEQTKIANFLSSLDTKISQNRKALEETQKFKKALLQKMFV